MPDGISAAVAAEEARRQAAALTRRADNFEAAARSEAEVARVLASLRHLMTLNDRRLPGSNSANVDHVAVGPTGIFVLDTKDWSAPRVAGGSLWDGNVNCDEDVAYVESIARRLDAALAVLAETPPAVVPILVFVGHAPPATSLGRVHLTSLDDLPRLLADSSDEDRWLSPRAVDAVFQVLLSALPPVGAPEAPLVDVMPLPKVPAARTADPQLSFLDVEDLRLAEFEAALRLPVEDWMVFLDGSQRKVAYRTVNGSSCVRGAAGTGKTAIALHRAAHLASSRPGDILFVTYVRTLAPALGHMYCRLSPATAARVSFTHLHGWAMRYLRSQGVDYTLDDPHRKRAISAALIEWKATGVAEQLSVPFDYLKDEISCVLKGRGLTTFEEYAALDRVGRRTPLVRRQRELVWDFFDRYRAAQRRLGVVDYDDLIGMAYERLLRDPRPPSFAAVIVDEVQDLSLVGVRLLHALAGGDVADGLTLVGDGQQSVYPGGFRLSEAGVDVRGRSTVLRTNYRNTDEILSFATRLVVGVPFADLDEDGSRDEISSERHGRRPSPLKFPTEQMHDEVLVDHVRTLLLHDHVWHGDIAVIARTNKAVEHFVTKLRAAGIPALNLADHDGTPREQVRVTTYQRAKGLEFKHVLLPRLDPDGLGISARRPTGKTGEVYDEQIELLRRQLFVAMTRARDSLWVGFIGTNALDMLVS
jgi:hypothetical protein